jgi:NAD(P)H-dependent flavin oxidoreductase YrpB (nitropropane dioxygenase family)
MDGIRKTTPKKGRNIMSCVTEILGCQYPVIQGAMGVISNPEMEDSWVKGDLDAGTLPAGQVSGLISSIRSVREIIEEMVKP